MYELTGTMAACTGLSQMSPELREGGRHRVPSYPRCFCKRYLLGKRKFSFLQWSVIGYIDNSPGQALVPRGVTKMNRIDTHLT